MSHLENQRDSQPAKQFRLGKSRAMLAGVCSGIADYTGWDVTLIRLAFALTTIFVVGTPILLYLIVWAIAD
ncbi:PspC domain-containing protein [Citromicrobium bathyomarinum]|uniref:PspC domain-containing protein n=1 Tax=Citromicrobium bathyomarinum TaxID=72174 RepID=UPI00315ABE01